MADPIISQEALIGQNWEEELYQEECAQMREKARRLLQELDDWLYRQAPADWEVVGFRERTVRAQRRCAPTALGR